MRIKSFGRHKVFSPRDVKLNPNDQQSFHNLTLDLNQQSFRNLTLDLNCSFVIITSFNYEKSGALTDFEMEWNDVLNKERISHISAEVKILAYSPTEIFLTKYILDGKKFFVEPIVTFDSIESIYYEKQKTNSNVIVRTNPDKNNIVSSIRGFKIVLKENEHLKKTFSFGKSIRKILRGKLYD